jgi:hypothetical protein
MSGSTLELEEHRTALTGHCYRMLGSPVDAVQRDDGPRLAGLAGFDGRSSRTGRVLTGLATLFLAFDATGKVLELAPAVEGTAQLGSPTSVLFGLGVVQLVCLAVYLPR